MEQRTDALSRLFDAHRAGRLSRRDLLTGAAALGVLLAGSSLLPGLARAQERPQGTPKKGGTLKVAVPAATVIDPPRLNSSAAIAIVQQAAEYLVYAEPDLRLRPVLATAWTPSQGNRVWTFTLRTGVRFHDGRPFTADDVVATFRRLLDPATASPAAAALSFLKKEGVEKIDDHTVRFTLDRPIGSFPYYTQIYQAAILPADYAGNFAEKPVGTGPFRLVSYKPQQGARFERNADYWDAGKPHLDAIEIQTFESPQPQILALQAGAVQVVQQLSFIDAQAILNNRSITLIEADAADHRQLALRTDQKPFDDKRVRQAMALAFNRPALVQGLLGGKASLGNDHPIAPIYREKVDLPQRAVDIDQARKLLAAAGYPNGFTADLYTHQYLELPQYAALAQQLLAQIGVKINLKVEPTNLYYNHWTEVALGLTDWTSRPTPEQILSQSLLSTAEWNAAHWKNPEFDALVGRLEAETDAAERSRIATSIARILNDEVPVVITYFTRNLRAAHGSVRNLRGSPSNYLELTDVWLEA